MAQSPMAESTPGTRSVPGQTPQTIGAGPAAPDRPDYLQQLLDRWPGSFVPAWRFADGIATAAVSPEHLVEVVRWLREASEPRFDLLVDICGAHWPQRQLPFEVTYIFQSVATNARLRLKCSVGGEAPALPTISHYWPAANWPEREIYDMFGLTFDGHAELRRLLMPTDWEGHPLRKDFPLGEEPVEFYRPPSPRSPSPAPAASLSPDGSASMTTA